MNRRTRRLAPGLVAIGLGLAWLGTAAATQTGAKWVTASTEAWARWTDPKASLTIISARLASDLAN